MFNRWLLTGICLALLIPKATCASDPTVLQKKPGYKVVGYFLARSDANRRYTPDNIQADKLTHLNYAFAAIRNGQVALPENVPVAQSKADFARLVALKKSSPPLRTLISVGGWAGSQEFSNIALTATSRRRFAASALAFVRRYGFDGVDIDWEFPVAGGMEENARRAQDKQNYTRLFGALRKQLDMAGKRARRHYLLTAAIGNNRQFLDNTEMAKVVRFLDWANIMTYDFNGHWNQYAGHHAPLYGDPALKRDGVDESASIDTIVDLTLKAGVPPKKLVLGMPFYGYSWKQCGATDHGQLQDCQGKGRGTWEDGVLDFSDINDNLINKNGFIRYWNDTVKTPYLFNDRTGEFVSYDDAESLGYKVDYLKKRGLGGAMFWEISGDRDFVLQNRLAHDLLGK